jgi:hypothetical protein
VVDGIAVLRRMIRMALVLMVMQVRVGIDEILLKLKPGTVVQARIAKKV